MVTPVTTVVTNWVTQPDSPYKGRTDGGSPLNTRPTGQVSISGILVEDEVLTASSTLADVDTIGALSYQWVNSASGNIAGATNSTYTIQASDVGDTIHVVVTYTDGAGQLESVASSSTLTVETPTSTSYCSLRSGDIMCLDFSTVSTNHSVTNSDIASWFGAEHIQIGTVDIVADPGGAGNGNVMRVFRAAGTYSDGDGISGLHFRTFFSNIAGADSTYTDIYLAFKIWLDPAEPASKEQKLPGFVAGDWEGSSLLGEKYSARPILLGTTAGQPEDDLVCVYMYDTNQTQKTIPGNQELTRGTWAEIEIYVNSNTYGVKNGISTIWVDGVQVASKTDREWRDEQNPNMYWDGLYFTLAYGGNNSTFNAPTDRYDYYTDFVISESPITH